MIIEAECPQKVINFYQIVGNFVITESSWLSRSYKKIVLVGIRPS